MRLFEISQELEVIQSMLEQDDVDQESFGAALASLNIEYEAKVANTGLLIKNLKADEAAISEAIKGLQSKKSTVARRIDWLKGYIAENFNGKVKTPLVSVSMQKGREKLVVDEGATFQPDYYKEPELDKSLVKQAITDGFEFDGARIERGDDFVVVR